jgi:hypothetical protein
MNASRKVLGSSDSAIIMFFKVVSKVFRNTVIMVFIVILFKNILK